MIVLLAWAALIAGSLATLAVVLVLDRLGLLHREIAGGRAG